MRLPPRRPAAERFETEDAAVDLKRLSLPVQTLSPRQTRLAPFPSRRDGMIIECLDQQKHAAPATGSDIRLSRLSCNRTSIMPQEDPLLDHAVTMLRRSRSFPLATPDDLASIAADASWFSVPGGSTLFKQHEPSDSLYLLLSGLLGAYAADATGGEALIGRIGSGEVVGEMGCGTGEPRSATIRALRSSEVLRISRDHLERVAGRNPEILMSLCRTVIGRMQSIQKGKPDRYWPRTFCVLANDDGVDARLFAEQFTAALGIKRTALLATRDTCRGYTADELYALEARYENVIYLAEPPDYAWSRLCLRQADTVLVVARGASEPKPITSLGQDVQSGIPLELVLLWDR